jgi:hypothetical protein
MQGICREPHSGNRDLSGEPVLALLLGPIERKVLADEALETEVGRLGSGADGPLDLRRQKGQSHAAPDMVRAMAGSARDLRKRHAGLVRQTRLERGQGG